MEAYYPLHKCYYNRQYNFEYEYQSRFNSVLSFHLPFSINGYPSFFIHSEQINDLVYEILKINGDIQWSSARLDKERALNTLLKTCLIKEIEKSNELEQVYSSKKELSALTKNRLEDHAGKKFLGQIRQYSALMEEKLTFPEDSTDIRDMFDSLLAEDIKNAKEDNLPDGKIFRKDSVEITDGTKAIHKGISPEEEIIKTLDKSIESIRSLKIPTAAAVFHFIFEYVHPFYDGNGRMGRFLSTLQLSKDLELCGVLQLSLQLRTDRTKYYKVFKECEDIRNRADLTPFVIFFLEKLLDALKEGKEMLHHKEQQYNNGLAQIAQTKPSSKNEETFLNLLLRSALFDIEGLPVTEIENHLNLSYSTVKKMIKKYSEILYVEKDGKSYLYSLHYDFINGEKTFLSPNK